MTHNHNPLPEHELLTHKSFLKSLNTVDCLFALLTAAGAFFAQTRIQHAMDIYEMVIFVGKRGHYRLFRLVFQTHALVCPLVCRPRIQRRHALQWRNHAFRRLPAQILPQQPVRDYVAMRLRLLRTLRLHHRRRAGTTQKRRHQHPARHGLRLCLGVCRRRLYRTFSALARKLPPAP